MNARETASVVATLKAAIAVLETVRSDDVNSATRVAVDNARRDLVATVRSIGRDD